jgi:hypothetical protein
MNNCQDGIDYRRFYDANIESYLLTEVRKRFEESGEIGLLDFCFILYWKSARTVPHHKRRLRERAGGSLACAVKQIAKGLYDATDSKDRLRLLMNDWGFRLPKATAILTLLFPEGFTVYDKRVCKLLTDFHELQERRFTDRLWDRYLWGKSFYEQILKDCC